MFITILQEFQVQCSLIQTVTELETIGCGTYHREGPLMKNGVKSGWQTEKLEIRCVYFSTLRILEFIYHDRMKMTSIKILCFESFCLTKSVFPMKHSNKKNLYSVIHSFFQYFDVPVRFWGTPTGYNPPRDSPQCGFYGQLCDKESKIQNINNKINKWFLRWILLTVVLIFEFSLK